MAITQLIKALKIEKLTMIILLSQSQTKIPNKNKKKEMMKTWMMTNLTIAYAKIIFQLKRVRSKLKSK